MGIKSIISIIAFVASFFLSSSLALLLNGGKPASYPRLEARGASCNKGAARRISNLLRQDIANGRTRQAAFADSDEDATTAEPVENYVSASENLDTAGLPEDFQRAWRAHMRAWRVHADYLNRFKDKEMSDSERRIYDQQSEEINETWYEVLRVARNYGADIYPNQNYFFD
jgi:hypothetical protein